MHQEETKKPRRRKPGAVVKIDDGLSSMIRESERVEAQIDRLDVGGKRT